MIVIGTAGHIDHGKTTLIRTLTGIETDRLKQEQERGISIELGFAYLDLPSGERYGIVDVPGHEGYVRQMIAGASGIDMVLLVIAADDDGVMPQAREHFDICRLLGIDRGLIVLTKVDLVEEDWLDLVEADVMDMVAGSFLCGAPVVRFASTDPSTFEPVKKAIAEVAATVEHRQGRRGERAPLRLPIDRVFTMKGFGTVVTGTVCSGTLATGDQVVVLPSGQRARVRGIQSHNDRAKEVTVGQRAAVNLLGMEKEAVSRGEVLAHPGSLEPTRMLDVELHLLPHLPRPLETQAKALVHVGTEQATGTIVLLDRDVLEPGHGAPAQLRLDRFVVALGGDHVVLRGFELLESYGKTLGGGVIVHPAPRKHRRGQPGVLEAFTALRTADATTRAEHAVRLAGHLGATLAHVAQVLAASAAEVDAALSPLEGAGRVRRYVEDGVPRLVHDSWFTELLTFAAERLDEYHAAYAHRAGIPREELRSQLRQPLPPKYFAEIVANMEAAGTAETAGMYLRRVGFVPTLSAELSDIRDRLLARYRAAGLEPDPADEVAASIAEAAGARLTDVQEVVELLVADGSLSRPQEKLVFAAEHVKRLEEQVVAFLTEHGEMTTPQLKTLTGTSRKYTVPLGEYLDARKITIRSGDVRRLRSGGA